MRSSFSPFQILHQRYQHGSVHPLLWRRLGIAGLLLTATLAVLLGIEATYRPLGKSHEAPTRYRILLVFRLLASCSGALTLLAWHRALSPDGSAVAHGSAHWGSASEVSSVRSLGRESRLLNDPELRLPRESVLLGEGEDGPVVVTGHLLRQHGVIVGASGTGKTRGFILPNAALQEGMSLLCTDPKSELWHQTAGRYAAPQRYAPVEPEASCCFNWIPLCADPRYAELCARTLIEAGEERSRPAEAVWIEAETAFLAALFAHTATLTEPTPLTAYQLFTRQKQADLLEQLAASPSEVAQEQTFIFQQTQERMRGSIVPAIAAKLQFLRDPRVARFTSAELTALNLGSLRCSLGAAYWCLPEQDVVRLRPLSSLFFALAMDQIVRAAPEKDEEGVTVLTLLDEFANIGPLPHFDSMLTLARSRGLSVWLCLQCLSQLEDHYGKPAANTILANCATRIALAGLDPESAEYVSKLLGQATVTLSRPSWSLTHFLGRTSGVSYQRASSPRPLLTADEVRRLDANEALAVLFNHPPIRLRKYWYNLLPEPIGHSPLGPARSVLPTPAAGIEKGLRDTDTPPPFPGELIPLGDEDMRGSAPIFPQPTKKKKFSRPFRPRRHVTVVPPRSP
jgi:type IV secretion system protein VirD4